MSPSNTLEPKPEELRNIWSWTRHWSPLAQEAVNWACLQFPHEIQCRGIARGYYEYLWNIDEIVRMFPSGLAKLRVMDVGCGAGVQTLALRRLGACVTALDRFEEYKELHDNQMGDIGDIIARFESNGILIEKRDLVIEELPPATSKFDLVTSFAVIEHLSQSPRTLLQSIYHALRPGGYVVITTPNHAWIRTRLRLLLGQSAHHILSDWWQSPFFGHVREYTMSELNVMLKWAGFHVVHKAYSNSSHFSSRIRDHGQGPDKWTTRFTLSSFERWLVLGSLLVSSLVPSLRYSMLIIGHKPEDSD